MHLKPTTVILKDGRTALLRSAVVEDAAALLDNLRQVFRESWRNMNHPPSHFDAFTETMEAALIRNHDEHPRNFILLALVEERVVGSLGMTASHLPFMPHVAELGMSLVEAYQGLGLGKALLERAIAEAEQAGLWNLKLHVRAFNEPAIRLYEQLGFRRVGTLQAVADLGDSLADEHLYQRLGRRPTA